MKWEVIEPWDYIVISVSSEYHKKFPMIELDDIKQSLYQWFVEHPNKLKEWEAIGKKDAKNLIYRSLRNDALDYCQKWKAKTVGYDVSDVQFYDKSTIEMLLPSIFMEKNSDLPKLNIGIPGKPPAPAEGGNILVMILEIDSAYHKLSIEDRKVLFYKYAEHLDYPDIAKEMQLGSEDAARMRHNRAINKLVNKLGGFKPFVDLDSSEKPNEIVETDNDEGNDEWTEEGE